MRTAPEGRVPSGDGDTGLSEPGVVDDAVVREAWRVARLVVRRQPVPSRWREDVTAEAAVAIVEAWGSAQLHGRSGMWQVAWRASEAWSKSLVCGQVRPTRAGHVRWAELPSVMPWDAHVIQGVAVSASAAEAPSADATAVGGMLVRLVDELVAEGMAEDLAEAAVAVAVDVLGEARQQRRSIGPVPAAEVIAEMSGIGLWSARALVVLLVGPSRRSGRVPVAGLLERGLRGDDVWSDPRVARQVDEVVWPSRSRPRGAWETPGEGPSRRSA